MTRLTSLIFSILTLAACSLTGSDTLYLFEPSPSQMRIATNVRSIEIMEVSLPLYANAPEILVQSETGAVASGSKNIWADTPSRSFAAALGRNLSEITGTITATEPWPLERYPDIRLEVRVDQMIADASGNFSLTGQYFLTPVERNIRDRAVRFDIAEPVDGDGYVAYSDAASRAVRRLSEQIAAQLAK